MLSKAQRGGAAAAGVDGGGDCAGVGDGRRAGSVDAEEGYEMSEENRVQVDILAEAMHEMHTRDLRIAELEVLGQHMVDTLEAFIRSLIGTGRAKDSDVTLAVLKAQSAMEAALQRPTKKGV